MKVISSMIYVHL
jgi:hypothetical protein